MKRKLAPCFLWILVEHACNLYESEETVSNGQNTLLSAIHRWIWAQKYKPTFISLYILFLKCTENNLIQIQKSYTKDITCTKTSY